MLCCRMDEGKGCEPGAAPRSRRNATDRSATRNLRSHRRTEAMMESTTLDYDSILVILSLNVRREGMNGRE